MWADLHRWLCPDGYSMVNCYRPGPPGLLFDTVVHMSGLLSRSSRRRLFIFSRYIFGSRR
jgi:hypothetical protein